MEGRRRQTPRYPVEQYALGAKRGVRDADGIRGLGLPTPSDDVIEIEDEIEIEDSDDDDFAKAQGGGGGGRVGQGGARSAARAAAAVAASRRGDDAEARRFKEVVAALNLWAEAFGIFISIKQQAAVRGGAAGRPSQLALCAW